MCRPLLVVCLLLPACERHPSPTSAPAPGAVTPATDHAALDVLLRAMHRRLDLMHTVARVKWNTQAPIFDPGREKALLADVAERGRAHSLDAEFTRAFFAAQMEAARLVQEDDFRRWRAEKQPPFPDAPTLAILRSQLDLLNVELLAALATARPLLDTPDGQRQLDSRAAALLADIPAPIRDTAIRPLSRSRTP